MMNNNIPVAVLKNRKSTLPIFNLPTVIGRNDQAVDVYLYHESISREHCVFEYIDGMITIKDLGSTVGTSINGGKLEPGIPYQLEPGCKLKIGKVKFNVEINSDELFRRAQEGFAAPSQSGLADQGDFAPAFAQEEQSYFAQQNEAPAAAEEEYVPGQRRLKVKAKELGDNEYDESEVVYIDCGISPDSKPLSDTDSVNRDDIEEAIEEDSAEIAQQSEDGIRETQSMDMEEAEEALAEAEGDVVSSLLEADDESTVILSVSQAEQAQDSASSEGVKKTTLSWIDDESGEIMRLVIDRYPFSIGRKSEENDYVIRRKGISRKHMTFDIKDGDVYICDENSTNGIRVSGEKIEPGEFTEIVSGDGIRAGGITFAVKIED